MVIHEKSSVAMEASVLPKSSDRARDGREICRSAITHQEKTALSTGLATRERMDVQDVLVVDAAPLDLVKRKKALRGRFGFMRRQKALVAAAMALILAAGIFLRVYPSAGFRKIGPDEFGYMVFFHQIKSAGVINYDSVVRVFVERQYQRRDALVPPTRLGFLIPAYFCGEVFHLGGFRALRVMACTAGILMLALCAFFGHRLGGNGAMIGLTALVATSPLQIYLSQRALIDGYFAFWAVTVLWLAWENLQRPRHWGWLTAYTLCLTMLVLTKENGAFVVFALFGVLLLNRFLRVGTATPHLFVATIVGPAIAILVLAAMIGGLGEWVRFYLMFEGKSRTNIYSMLAQDGPWYRYLVDFVLVSPLLVVFAIGGMFRLRRTDKAGIFMASFLALSAASMSCVTYGMSLRYAAYWDIPLCWVALAQVRLLSEKSGKFRSPLVTPVLILVLGVSGLSQYYRFFVKGAVYDPITASLVRGAALYKPAQGLRPDLSLQGLKNDTTNSKGAPDSAVLGAPGNALHSDNP